MQTDKWRHLRNRIIQFAERFLPAGLPRADRPDYVRMVVVIIGAMIINCSYIPGYIFWDHSAARPLTYNAFGNLLSFILALAFIRMGRLLLSIAQVIIGAMLSLAFASWVFGKAMNMHFYMILVACAVIVIHPKKNRWVALVYGVVGLFFFLGVELYAPEQPMFGDPFSLTMSRLSTMQVLASVYAGQLAFTWWFQVHAEKISEELAREKERSENLLLNILPGSIAERLKESDGEIADGFENVTVLFADIVNFTEMAKELGPREIVQYLNEIFTHFDELTHEFGLEKIKTIGDAYMVAGGIPQSRPDHAEAVMRLAQAMLQYTSSASSPTGAAVQVRIGINSGPVIAGVIGVRKFIYDLWGDTVNMASRLESSGVINRVQVSESTYQLLKDKFAFQQRDAVKLKGVGTTSTWLLAPAEASMEALNDAS